MRKSQSHSRAIAILEIAVVSAAAIASKSEKGRDVDDAVFTTINQGLRRFRQVFWIVTQGGWFGSVLVWCAICLWTGKKRLALDILGAALLSWILSQAGKELVALERPWERLDEIHRIGGVPWGSSFPSGHPAVSFAVARALSFDSSIPAELKQFAYLWSLGVALSRMVVGAHYPLDVIGGSALGDLAARIWREVTAGLSGTDHLLGG